MSKPGAGTVAREIANGAPRLACRLRLTRSGATGGKLNEPVGYRALPEEDDAYRLEQDDEIRTSV
jgi:hypothetical protein